MFDAIWLTKSGDTVTAALRRTRPEELPENDTEVSVEWSTINYKDALAITNTSPVVRKFPIIPGIDLAGTVVRSSSSTMRPGTKVLMTGFGYGELHCGGFSQRASVAAEHLIAVPEPLDTRSAMCVGTAGFTAMLAVQRIQEHGISPSDGDVLVTGAGGGVGGYAVAFLARKGYRVVASTGRPEEAERIRRLGAAEVIERRSLSEPGRPLSKERWAAVVDSVGSHTLVNACASTRYGGIVAACGLAQGMDFPGTVAPFILRGVTLAGIDSVYYPAARRPAIWKEIAALVTDDLLKDMQTEIALSEVIPTAQALLDNQVRGRVIVRMS